MQVTHIVGVLGFINTIQTRQLQHQQLQCNQLGGECLGGGHTDLGSGTRHQYQVGLAYDRTLGDITNSQCRDIAGLFRMLQSSQCIGRFTGLGYGYEKGVLWYDRLAVTILAGNLGPAGNTGQLLKLVTGNEPRMVGRATGNNMNLTDLLQ